MQSFRPEFIMCSASHHAGHYPASGINLGPALTFGHIAGRDLARATRYEDDGELPEAGPAFRDSLTA
jgi:hypothetical protein